jgi:enoyl-CoA hydratase/carnithine racemase
MADETFVRYELKQEAAFITLDAPKTRNALTAAIVSDLIAHLKRAHADDAVRAIVLTGSGTAFCAGADLRARGNMGDATPSGGNPFVELLKLMRDGDKPVIAAVNGAAFGGGAGLVAAADISIASANASFSFSEVRLGVIPAMISVVVLPKLGEHQTMRLFLTGERFNAHEAQGYGLLHKVVAADQLEQTVLAEARAIAAGGPNAIREAKALVRNIAKLSEEAGYAYAEEKIAKLFASEEAAEGIAAFVGKRPAAWIKSKVNE